MSNNFPIIRDNDVLYQVRPCAIDGGQTPIQPVHVPVANTIDEIKHYISKGVYTEDRVCGLLTAALAIDIQAAARRAATGGAIPKRDYARLFKSIDIETLIDVQKTRDDPKAAIDKMIDEMYRAELAPTLAQEPQDSEEGEED